MASLDTFRFVLVLVLGTIILASFLIGMFEDITLGSTILGNGFAVTLHSAIIASPTALWHCLPWSSLIMEVFPRQDIIMEGKEERKKKEGPRGQSSKKY